MMDPVELEGVERADDEWVSLQQASEMLGVAASTVRRWADAGRVPVKRTLGGHRRFSRSAVLEVARSLSADTAAPPAAPAPETAAQASQHKEWQARFATLPATGRMRELGQQLLGVLLQFVTRRDEEERFLREARGIGERYGAAAHAVGVSMGGTIEMFLSFRNAHTQYAVPAPRATHTAALAEFVETRARVDRFMDTLLLGVVAGHEKGDVEGGSPGGMR